MFNLYGIEMVEFEFDNLKLCYLQNMYHFVVLKRRYILWITGNRFCILSQRSKLRSTFLCPSNPTLGRRRCEHRHHFWKKKVHPENTTIQPDSKECKGANTITRISNVLAAYFLPLHRLILFLKNTKLCLPFPKMCHT